MTASIVPLRFARATRRAFGAAVILAAALAVGAPLYFFLAHVPAAKREMLDALGRELSARTDQRQMGLERWVEEGFEDAATVATFPSVQDLLTKATDRRRPGALEIAHVRALLGLFASAQHLERALVVEARTGRVTTAYGSPRLSSGEERLIRGTLASGKPEAGFHRQPITAAPDVGFAMRVRDPRGRVVGAVLLEADPAEWLYPFLLVAAPLPYPSSETNLVEQRADTVVWVSPRRKSSAPPLAERRLLADLRGLPPFSALRGGSRLATYVDYAGAPVVASTRRIAGTTWGLVVKVDQTDVDGPFDARMRREGAGWGAALAAVLGLATVLWWNARRTVGIEVERGRARIAAALNQANDAILVISADGRILDANRRAEEFYGGGPGGLVGRPVAGLRPETDRAAAQQALAESLEHETLVFESRHVAADGTVVPVEVSVRQVHLDGEAQLVSVIRDVRERKAAEHHIQRLNRALRTISEVNQLIVRETSPERLFAEACRVLVEEGGFRMAWIGIAEAGGSIQPVADAGAETGYLADAQIRWDDTPEGRGPIGTALRERRTVTCDDYATDPAMAPWREAALARGFRSSVSCPIPRAGASAGVLIVYADEPGAFDAEIVALLEELASDIGFALQASDDHAARERAEQDLRRSETSLRASAESLRRREQSFRLLFESNPLCMWVYDISSLAFLAVNDAAVAKYGWSRSEFLAMRLPDIRPPEDVGRLQDDLARPRPTLQRSEGWRHRLEDGTVILVEIVSHTIAFEGREAVLVAALDITERVRAEEALRSSEAKLRAFFDSSATGILFGDVHGNILDANDEFLRIVGYGRDDLAAGRLRWSDITPPEFAAADAAAVAEASARGTCTPFEKQYVRKDGTRVWVLVGFALLGETRERSAAFVVDISARKRAEAAVHLTEGRYRALFQGMLEGFAHCRMVFDGDVPVDWVYLDVNTAFGRLTGLHGIAGKRVTEAIPGIRETNPELFELYGRVARTAEPGHLDSYVPALGIWFSISVYCPAPGEFVAVFENITERRAAFERLRQRERDLEEAQRIGRVGSFVGDQRTGAWVGTPVLDEILGIEPSWEKTSAHFEELVHPDDRPRFAAHYRDILARGAPFELDYRIVRQQDGAVRWVSGHGALTVDDAGVPVTMVGTIQDITDRREAEEEVRRLNAELEARVAERTLQLEAANQELEAFAYSVSHDLRAPLRAIDGFGRILEEDHAPRLDDEGRRLLGVVRRSTKGMGQLIDDLLSFSRAGRGELARVRIDMSSLAREVWAGLAPSEELARVAFTAEELPETDADPALIRQVWTNLLANALKFTRGRPAPTVVVGARLEAGQAVYFVRDNGVGFDPRYTDKLFGVFQRLHPSAEFEGTGVGLALVHRIVTRHGGTVWAEGAVGGGATFSFTLPATGDA